MEPNEVLRAAADKLRFGKWIQSKMYDEFGGMCTAGAMLRVANDTDELNSRIYPQALEIVSKYLHEKFGYRNIEVYNDDPTRTKYECVDLLMNAAKAYENGEIVL